MATTELSLENLKQHVGRRATSTDVVTPGSANLLLLAFARPDPEFRDGDPLPPGWQILYFLPRFGPTSFGLMAARSTPAWCRRCRYRAACSLASACASTSRSGSATRSGARPSSPTSR